MPPFSPQIPDDITKATFIDPEFINEKADFGLFKADLEDNHNLAEIQIKLQDKFKYQ